MEIIPANINAIQLLGYSVEQQIAHSMLIHLFLGLIAFVLYTATASLVRGVGCWSDIALNLVTGTSLYFLVFGSLQESFIVEKVFFWVPERFFLTKNLTVYSQSTLIVTLILGVLLDGRAGLMKEVDFAAIRCCWSIVYRD